MNMKKKFKNKYPNFFSKKKNHLTRVCRKKMEVSYDQPKGCWIGYLLDIHIINILIKKKKKVFISKNHVILLCLLFDNIGHSEINVSTWQIKTIFLAESKIIHVPPNGFVTNFSRLKVCCFPLYQLGKRQAKAAIQ